MNLYGKIIVIKRNGTDGAHFPLTVNCCLFGRSLDCDIRIQLPSVDLSQCQIEIDAVGHVFIKDLSKLAPTLVNSKTLSQTLTALSHGDIITIVDRQFRFEYPPGSRFFPAKSPKVKSPKTPSSGKAVGNMSPRPVTPLSPRTDNVPSSSQTGKVSKSPVSAKKELNANNNRISKHSADLALPSNLLFSVSPATKVPVSKARLSAASSPGGLGMKMKSPVKPNVGSPYPKGGSNLRKSITDLRRRSMPVFEMDEAASPNLVISKSQKKITPVAQKKRKSPGFTVPSAKRKRVSFGPSLSPEHFDKNLPPKTPVKKGATPSVNEGNLRKSLVKGKTNASKARSPSPAKKGTPGRPRSISPKKNVTPAKSKSPSPAKKGTPVKPQSPSSAKKGTPGRPRSISPKTNVTPAKPQSPSPAKKGTPGRPRSISPQKIVTPVPAINVTPSKSTLAKPESPSPAKKGSPGRPRSVSPAKTATPAKQKSQSAKKSTPKPESPSSAKKGTPGRPRSVSPVKAATPGKSSGPSPAKKGSPGRPRSVSPAKTATLAKLKGQSSAKKSTPAKPENSSGTKAVTPAKSSSPSPAKKGTPGRPRSISPHKNDTLAKSKTPSTAKKATPGRPRSLSPTKIVTPAKSRSPSSSKKATPKSQGVKPSVQKSGSPKDVPMSPDTDLFSQLTPLKPQQSRASIEETPKSSVKWLGKGSLKKALKSDATISPLGLKRLMKTPIPDTTLSPTGIKRLMKTPKANVSPSPVGLGKLMKTPARAATPAKSSSQSPTKEATPAKQMSTSARKATPGRPRSVSPAKAATPAKSLSPSPAKKATPGRPRSISPAKAASPDKSAKKATPAKSLSNSPKVIKVVQINAPSPLGSIRHTKTPVVKRAGHHAKSPIALNLQSPSGKLAVASSLAGVTPKQKSVLKTPTSQSPTVSRPQSLKSGRTPKLKKIFYSSPEPKASTPKIGRKSLGESSKSGLKEKIARFASPGEKIIAPPQDINKVVALRAIHGITPKLAILQKAAGMTPKSGKKGKVSTPGKKDNVQTPKSRKKGLTPKSVKKVKSWADIVKTGKPARQPSSLAARKKTPKKVVKKSAIKAKEYISSSPSTSQFGSPATVFIGRKALGKTKLKTPKPLPRKGRKKSMGKARKSLGNVSYSGVEEMFKSHEQPSSPQLSESALYAEIPDTPSGPNEMIVSPLSERRSKSPGSRKSVKLTGIKELFSKDKTGTVVSMVGVKELFQKPKTPASVNLKGVRELMRSPKAVQSASPSGVKQLFATPENVVSNKESSGVNSSRKQSLPVATTPKTTGKGGRGKKRKIDEAEAAPSSKKAAVDILDSLSPVKPRTTRRGAAKKSPVKKVVAVKSVSPVKQVSESPKKTITEKVATPSPVKPRTTRRGAAKKSPVKKVLAAKSVSPVKQVSASPKKTITKNVTSPSPLKPRATRRGAAARKSPVKKSTEPTKQKGIKPTPAVDLKLVSEPVNSPVVQVITPSPAKSRTTRRGVVSKQSPSKKAVPVKNASKTKAVKETQKRTSPVKKTTRTKAVTISELESVCEPTVMSPVKRARRGAPAPSPKKAQVVSVKSPAVKAVSPQVANKRRGKKEKTIAQSSNEDILPSPAKPRTTRRGAAAKQTPKKATPVNKTTKTKAVTLSEPVNDAQLPAKQSSKRGPKDPKPATSRKRKAELESVSEPTVKAPIKRAKKGAPVVSSAPSPKTPATSKGAKRVKKTAESLKIKASPKSTRSKKVAQKPTIKSKSPKKPVQKDTAKSPVQLASRTRRTRAI